jgi:uncharacterized iron-regulated protein
MPRPDILIPTILLLGAAASILGSCAAPRPAGPDSTSGPPVLIDAGDPQAVAAVLDDIRDRDVIFVGETHDRYDHHLNQLAVIRGLHERGAGLAIGMEQFQRPFQRHLDDFVAGRIDEATLLERTQWDDRWRFDVALYRDILDYARQHGIPLVALNAPTETVRQVSAYGIEGLGDAERALYPERIELARGDYRRQLESALRMHGPHMQDGHLQRFMEVQYVWDQTMARSAADYLRDHPGTTLVVLAGSGHVLHDDAIPGRLRRLQPGRQAVIVTDTGLMPEGANPDYVFSARNLMPPGAGQMARVNRR